MYHYKLCGLPNVFLQNGYSTTENKHGKAYRVENVKDLHKAIGFAVINSTEPLTGEEVKFLRKEMLMSQESLACVLGLSESSVRKLETNRLKHEKIDPTDRLIRIIFANYLKEKSKLRAAINKLNNLSNGSVKQDKLCFKETNNEWLQEARACT